MKKILVLVCLLGCSSYASIKDCEFLLSEYYCEYDGKPVSLLIRKTEGSTNENEISIISEYSDSSVIVDGNIHQSRNDDTTYKATCDKKDGIEIEAFFQEESAGKISIIPTADGMTFRVVQEDSKREVPCEKVE